MIAIDRTRVREPQVLRTTGGEALGELRKHYDRGLAYRLTHRYPFRTDIWDRATVVRALRKVFHQKCAYCESRVEKAVGSTESKASRAAPQDIDHFRPKANALARSGRAHPDHYWWLAYDWSNLYLVCRACNRHKRNLFPTEGKRAEIGASPELLGNVERPELLDPCVDDPEPLLAYARDGSVSGRDLRAQSTIDILGLNRPELIERRRQAIDELKRALRPAFEAGPARVTQKLPAEVRRETRPRAEFAGLRRWILRRLFQGATAGTGHWLQPFLREVMPPGLPLHRRNKLRDHAQHTVRELEIGVEEAPVGRRHSKAARRARREELRKLRSWWIECIELENFMGIRELTVRFPPLTSDRDPWLMLLGANGVGKSAVLKAIALSLISPQLRDELVPDASKLMNHDAPGPRGHVAVRLNSGDTIELHFGRNTPKLRRTGRLPPLRVVGYGSTRRLPKPVSGKKKRSRPAKKRVQVKNLFDPLFCLADPERWLAYPEHHSAHRFGKLKPHLKKLLMMPEDATLSRHKGRLWVDQRSGRTSLREWSDGYQTVMALALDITYNLSKAGDSVDDVEGTVLLDEIEVHLHPAWKIRIVSLLRDLFPRVRFVVTTHDPLCLRGLERGEVCLMDRHPETGWVRIQPLDVPKGLRADQLLTGDWFGLDSTLDEGTLALLDEHRWLLLRSPKSRDERQRQAEIETELRERFGSFAETTPERIALSTAAEFMPTEARELSAGDKKELRAKIVQAIRSAEPEGGEHATLP